MTPRPSASGAAIIESHDRKAPMVSAGISRALLGLQVRPPLCMRILPAQEGACMRAYELALHKLCSEQRPWLRQELSRGLSTVRG